MVVSSGLDADPLRILVQLANLGAAIEREMKRRFGLTRGEYEILTLLERGPLPQKRLCAQTQSTPAFVSRWLMWLDREGWVTRQHPDNNQCDFLSRLSRRGVNQLRRIRRHMPEPCNRWPRRSRGQMSSFYQETETAPVDQRIGHEVDRSTFVRFCRHAHRHSCPSQLLAPLGAELKPFLGVDPMGATSTGSRSYYAVVSE